MPGWPRRSRTASSAEVFADPGDALEWLEHNRVDLVITDYKMPGMDGAEFTRRFRAMPGGRHVPVGGHHRL